MIEPRGDIKKLGWETDGGGSDMKFFKNYFNLGLRFTCEFSIGLSQ